MSVGGPGPRSRGFGSAIDRSGAALTRDGRFVAFTSDEQLIGADDNGRSDGYIVDRRTGALTRVRAAGELQLGAGRRHVAFITRRALSAVDTDERADVYLAQFRRTGG